MGQAKLFLADIKAKKIISHCNYKLGLPSSQRDALLQSDLIFHIRQKNARRCIDIFQQNLDRATESAPYSPIASIDLSKFSDLHSIYQLLSVGSLGRDEYDLKLIANWMDSKETTIVAKRIFWVRLRVDGNPESLDAYHAVVISSHLDSPIDEQDKVLKSYIRGEKWYHLVKHIQTCSFWVSRSPFDPGSRNQFFQTKHGEIAEKVGIEDVSVHDDFVYTVTRFRRNPQDPVDEQMVDLSVYKFQKIDEEGLSEPQLINSKRMNGNTKIYFYEVTDLFRIFCLTQEHDGARVDILGKELEVESRLKIKDILIRTASLSVIDTDNLSILAKIGTQEVGVGPVMVSLLVNILDKTVKIVVDETGKKIFGRHYRSPGGRFVVFTQDYYRMRGNACDGLWVSDLIQ